MSGSKVALYVGVAIAFVVLLIVLYNLLGAAGLLPAALPIALLGKMAKEEQKKAEDLKRVIKDIDKKQDDLKKTGVPDLTSKEEVDYWKKH